MVVGGELSTYPKVMAKIKVTAEMRLKTAETNIVISMPMTQNRGFEINFLSYFIESSCEKNLLN